MKMMQWVIDVRVLIHFCKFKVHGSMWNFIENRKGNMRSFIPILYFTILNSFMHYHSYFCPCEKQGDINPPSSNVQFIFNCQ